MEDALQLELVRTSEQISERITKQMNLLSSTIDPDLRQDLLIGLARTRQIIGRKNDDGSFSFGTTRFLGYDIPAADFLKHRKELHTTPAERAVLAHADEVDEYHPAAVAMVEWMHGLDVRPNRLVRVFLLRQGRALPPPPSDTSRWQKVADHIIGLFDALAPDQQAAVRRRLELITSIKPNL